MLTIDYSILVVIICFLILMVVLNSMLYKPIRQMLKKRESRMASIREEGEKYERNAQELLTNFEQKLADARATGQKAMEDLKEEARKEESSITEAGTKEAEVKKKELMAGLSTQVEAAKKDLLSKVDAFAMEISQKLLGRAI
ncbi:MAG: hypothetical protein GWP10_02390 [Nitrospiraceae bacterium]|nr:hypothetical protein [Nitrospiraceae bacterium]